LLNIAKTMLQAVHGDIFLNTIVACSKRGKWKEAQAILLEYEAANPNGYASGRGKKEKRDFLTWGFDTVICACVKANRLEEAREMLKGMIKASSKNELKAPNPTEFSYLVLVDGYLKRQWRSSARELLDEIPDHLRSAWFYDRLVETIPGQWRGMVPIAYNIKESGIEPTSFTVRYHTAERICCFCVHSHGVCAQLHARSMR
jgi:pentatricopeptide repeat protein